MAGALGQDLLEQGALLGAGDDAGRFAGETCLLAAAEAGGDRGRLGAEGAGQCFGIERHGGLAVAEHDPHLAHPHRQLPFRSRAERIT
ncbi:MAG: hypothetical protein R3C69_14475 [Geminicoccaceae bacterium]